MKWSALFKSAGISLAAAAMLPCNIAGASPVGFHMAEYQVSDAAAQPCNVQGTPDGALWVSLHQTNQLARLDPKTGAVTRFTLPGKTPLPGGGEIGPLPGPPIPSAGTCDMALGSDGNLWFNHQMANSVGYIETHAPYRIHEIPLPVSASIPMSMQAGGDDKIYVTLTAADKIAQVDPQTHAVRIFDVPTKLSMLIGGAAGPDNAHWFIEMSGNKLLRFDYATHRTREVSIPTPISAPFVMRSYDDGLWFTMFAANAIGHYDIRTGRFSTIPIPTPASAPVGLTLGRDGYLYTDESVADKIARIDRKTMRVVDEYPYMTKLTWPDEIKTGPDGAIWSPNFTAGKLTRLWVDSFGTDPGFPATHP